MGALRELTIWFIISTIVLVLWIVFYFYKKQWFWEDNKIILLQKHIINYKNSEDLQDKTLFVPIEEYLVKYSDTIFWNKICKKWIYVFWNVTSDKVISDWIPKEAKDINS